MFCVDLEKALDSVARKVLEWAFGKKITPKVLVRSVMSLYEESNTRVGVASKMSEEVEVKVGMKQEYVLSSLL